MVGDEAEEPEDDPNDPVVRDLKAEAVSEQHLRLHTPFNKYCPYCVRGRVRRKPARRQKGEPLGERPINPGDHYTGDHLVNLDPDDEYRLKGVDAKRVCMIMMDRAPAFLGAFPVGRRTSDLTVRAMQNFSGPGRRLKLFTSDGAKEYIAACRYLRWCHDTSGPHQHSKVAERVVQSVLLGAITILQAAGHPCFMWPWAVQHWCHARNVTPGPSGRSAWSERHGQGEFRGVIRAYGQLVRFIPQVNRAKEQHKFEEKAIPGIFLGWHLRPGMRWGSSRRGTLGDYYVIAVADVDYYDFYRSLSRAHVQRVRDVIDDSQTVDYTISFPCRSTYEELTSRVGPYNREEESLPCPQACLLYTSDAADE